MNRIALYIIIVSALFLSPRVYAQETIVLEPLFEYPVAPEEMTDLQSRSNFIVSNFWRQFDFDKKSVGQSQLNHAFGVFASALPWANEKVADDAVDQLLKNLKKRPGLLYQFTLAAEESLYSPSADFWIDEVYLKFLNAVHSSKKIKDIRKARFELQRTPLANSLKGKPLPDFEIVSPAGDKISFNVSAPLNIVEFGSPSCFDCRMTKLKLDTDMDIAEMIEKGALSIWFVVPDAESEENWQAELSDYPSAWTVGAGNELDMLVDMRKTPSLYLLDGDGNIILKNTGIDTVLNYIKSADR